MNQKMNDDDDDLQLSWWEAYIEMSEAIEDAKSVETQKKQIEDAYDRAMGII